VIPATIPPSGARRPIPLDSEQNPSGSKKRLLACRPNTRLLHRAANIIATIPLCSLIVLSISTASAIPSAPVSSISARTLGPTSDLDGNATSYASCLRVVQADARIDTYRNATSSGVEAVFSNGSRDYFPYASCVKPIHPDDYPIILAIGLSPTFVAAENGSLFSYYDFDTFSYLYSGLNYTQSSFYLYNGTLVDVCGSYMPWFTKSMTVAVPFNSTGNGLDLSKMIVLSGGYGPIATCTIRVTTTFSSTTITVNSTSRSSGVYPSNSTVKTTPPNTAVKTGSSFPFESASLAVVVVAVTSLATVFLLARSRRRGDASASQSS
jgi:hypothetical protein